MLIPSYAATRSRGIRNPASSLFPTVLVLLAGLAQVFAQAPTLTQPPTSTTIFYGDPAPFQVAATGSAPLRYQWLRNDSPLPNATNSSYTVFAVSAADHEATFSVVVTNSLGAITSAPAVLTVDFGLPGAAVTNRVLNFNSAWRYNLSNNLDGVNWTTPGYNDAAWPSGPVLLAAENNSAITPLIGTTLLAPNNPPAGLAQGHAYYFRTTFNVASNNLIPGGLIATGRADDGAMVYLNGTEALRLRLPTGTITNTSFTTGFPPGPGSDATVDESYLLDVITVPIGLNRIAASVHQANSGSSDIVWGLALDVVGYERIRDTVAPVIAALVPAAGSLVPAFSSLEVQFNEGVRGVDAADLLINGAPATNVIAAADDVYVFEFPPAPTGLVQVMWAANPGIRDRAANSNLFAGGGYQFNVNPNAVAAQVQITEFMAGNSKTIRDEDGDWSDWIEIHNAGTQPLDLGNWYLTDSATELTKWRFPAGFTIGPESYALIWASDKDRKVLNAPLHTNFRLSKSAGNFLGLIYSDGATVVSAFANYAAQNDDVSYGRDRIDSTFTGYFTNATPGAANTTAGLNFAPPVQFSRGSGTFQSGFPLTLSTSDPNTVIRYYLVTNAASAALTNVPNASSPIYTGPLNINSSVQVRARAYSTAPNTFPSAPASHTYLLLSSGAASFTSDLPIVLLHNFAGGTPPASVDQSAVMMVFGTEFGRASLTNPPDTVARIGMNIRGSSTEGFAKKSFAVETWDEFNDDLAVPVLGMPAESDWVFYAPNYFDKPWIHNPLMHELSRSVGRYSPRTQLAEVFTCFDNVQLNYSSPNVGHYNGLYVIQEKIKRDANRVNVPRLEPTDTNALAITGGYVLKIDRRDADEREFNAANQTIVFVEPQMKDFALYPGRSLQQNYLAGYFNSFYNALTGINWTNSVTGYAAWIDVDAWVDHHILNVLSRSCDAMRLSAYFFKDREGKIEMGPLWDFDRALGTSAGNDWRSWNPRSWMGSNPIGSSGGTDFGTDYFNPAGVFANPWYSRVVKDPNFWQKWIDRYHTLRPAEFSTNALFAIIDSLTNKLGVVQLRELTKWPDSFPRSGTVLPPSGWPDQSYAHTFSGTYAGEIAFLKRWLTDRLNFIDTNFLARPTLSLSGGPVNSGQTITLAPATKPNSRVLYTLNGTDPRLPGGAISPAALSNNGPVVLTVTTNIRVFARSWNPTHQNLTGSRNPPISSPWSGPAIESYYTSLPAVRVTEIMFHPPDPPAGNTNDADNFEFIELQNTSSAPLNLQGFQLSGGIDFTFPSLVLTGGQFVVVVKSVSAFQSRYGTAPLIAGVYEKTLANNNDRIALTGPLQEPILDFTYSDAWYPATDGAGFSLVIINALAARETWNLKSSWRPSGAIQGSPGVADPLPPNLSAVLINEVLTHTDPPLLDTIELFNPTINNVHLGGWFLTDDPQQPKKYRIPAGNFIAPGGYLTFDTTYFGSGPTGFAFGSTGDSVYLFSGDANTNLTGYAHGFVFGAAPNPVSFGRYRNSLAHEFFILQSANSLGQPNAYPRVGPVVISEIMYNPPALSDGTTDYLNEFIELHNVTATNVPLYHASFPTNTWRLRGGVDFEFPLNTTLPPNSRLLVVGFDPAIYSGLKSTFVAKYNVPTNVPVFGPWRGRLNNAGETVRLERPENPNITSTGIIVPFYQVESVTYSGSAPWPILADGGGASLQRIEVTLFADDPVNWQAALPSAGLANPAGLMVDVDQDGMADAWELANGFNPQSSDDATEDTDSDGASTGHEFIAGTDPNNAADYLRFTAVTMQNNICQLSFSSRSNRTYAVEFATALGLPTTWNVLTNGITGTSGPIIVNDPQPGPRYYRLQVRLNP